MFANRDNFDLAMSELTAEMFSNLDCKKMFIEANLDYLSGSGLLTLASVARKTGSKIEVAAPIDTKFDYQAAINDTVANYSAFYAIEQLRKIAEAIRKDPTALADKLGEVVNIEIPGSSLKKLLSPIEQADEINEFLDTPLSEKRKNVRPTQWNSINSLFNEGGPGLGQLVLIMAKTGVGKTLFLLNLMLHYGIDAGEKVYWWNSEMPIAQLATRVLSISTKESAIDAKMLAQTDVKGSCLAACREVVEKYRKSQIWRQDGSMTATQVVSFVMTGIKRGVKIFALDYIQNLDVDQEVRALKCAEHAVFCRVTKKLHELALKHNVLIFACAQINDEGQLEAARQMRNDCSSMLILSRIPDEERIAGRVSQQYSKQMRATYCQKLIEAGLWKQQYADELPFQFKISTGKNRNGTGETDRLFAFGGAKFTLTEYATVMEKYYDIKQERRQYLDGADCPGLSTAGTGVETETAYDDLDKNEKEKFKKEYF